MVSSSCAREGALGRVVDVVSVVHERYSTVAFLAVCKNLIEAQRAISAHP